MKWACELQAGFCGRFGCMLQCWCLLKSEYHCGSVCLWGLSHKMNYWGGVFIKLWLCFCSSAGASQLATRKAPGARGVRGGIPLLWRRHRPRAGRQAGAVWSRLSRNQQGEREHNKSLTACVLGHKIGKIKDAIYLICSMLSLFFL